MLSLPAGFVFALLSFPLPPALLIYFSRFYLPLFYVISIVNPCKNDGERLSWRFFVLFFHFFRISFEADQWNAFPRHRAAAVAQAESQVFFRSLSRATPISS